MMAKAIGAFLVKVGAATSIVGLGIYVNRSSSLNEAHASSPRLEPPEYPWSHRYPWQAFDHASLRRGFQVYKQVCATCHSLDLVAYRNLVDTCYTEAETKAIAAEDEVVDGPDDEGYSFKRPAKLSDHFPRPYENEKMARFANNGAYPPDLSCIVKGRFYGESYIFALLTGYRESPHGLDLRQGLYYNPYFAGGAIAMPQALIEGMVEYKDGTPSTISQMAKDVSTFLAWTSEPTQDERKLMGFKALFMIGLMTIPTFYWKQVMFSPLKTRVVQWSKDTLVHKVKKH